MPFDDEPDDDEPIPRAPLPPDDRIWRHPSELGAAPGGAGWPPPAPGTGADPGHPGNGWRSWALVGASALAGAGVTLVVLAFMGVLGEHIPIRAVEQVSISMPRDPDAPEQVVGRQASDTLARVAATTAGGIAYGTATTIRSDGYLVTTADLVGGGATIAVTLADGRALQAELVGSDDENDIAVIKVDAIDLPTATLATGTELALTDRVLALSAGDRWPEVRDVQAGVVSGVQQRVVTGSQVLHGLVQASVDLTGPSTGAALVTTDGAIVAMFTARGEDPDPSSTSADDPNRLGVHHATPIAWVKEVADEIVATGHPNHVWVGIEGVDLTADEADQTGGRGGAKLRRVMDGSPAAAADLHEGDVVTGLDGDPVTSMTDLVVSLRSHQAGDVVGVQFQREGEERVAMVQLADRP